MCGQCHLSNAGCWETQMSIIHTKRWTDFGSVWMTSVSMPYWSGFLSPKVRTLRLSARRISLRFASDARGLSTLGSRWQIQRSGTVSCWNSPGRPFLGPWDDSEKVTVYGDDSVAVDHRIEVRQTQMGNMYENVRRLKISNPVHWMKTAFSKTSSRCRSMFEMGL